MRSPGCPDFKDSEGVLGQWSNHGITYFQDELKAKGGVTKRKPFNRETDLEGPQNLVTPAKRRALMKDSKTSLENKFHRGARSFL